MTDKLTYTVREATEAIGIGRSMVYKLLNSGEVQVSAWADAS